MNPLVKATQVELHSSQLELGDWLKDNPRDRTPAIVVGRLFRAAEDHAGAIGTLTNFLGAKKRANETDADYAGAIYQRACYRCVWAGLKDGLAAGELKRSGLEDLRQYVALRPENAEAASQEGVDHGYKAIH